MRTAKPEHPGRPGPIPRRARAILAATTTVATVLVLILDPSAANVYALNMFGTLRVPGQPALVAGHRGDRALAPENTLPALQSALNSRMEFVETDVHLTADRIPVLIHDPTVDRTTDGTGEVRDLTLAEVKALDAGGWYSNEYAGTAVPTLDEFLAIFAHSTKKALIELKGFWRTEDVMIVRDLVYAKGVQNRVVFASIDFTTLRNIESVAPAFPRVIIRRELPPDPVSLARYYGAIGVLTSPTSVERAPSVVASMHAAGLGILLYTLNRESRWSEALALGVDGIVTDKPSELDDWLAATAPGT